MHLVFAATGMLGIAMHESFHDSVPAGGHYISLLAPNRRDPNPNRPSAYDPQSLVCAVQLTNPSPRLSLL